MIQEILPEHSNYKSVYCDIVHRCNMECANCYLPNRNLADLNTEKVIDFISKFKNKTEFRFIGGEPTLHKNLPEFIKHATSLGHRTTIATNGLRIASKSYLHKLKDAGLKTVYLSMTGFDDDKIYEVTDLLKCAEKKMAAFYNCINLKLRLSIGAIIIKNLNEHVVTKIINTIKNTNYRTGTSIEFRNIGQVGRYMKDKDENYKFDELKNLIFKKLKFVPEQKHILENNQYSYTFKYGRLRINITNWEGVDEGFDNVTNETRGRLTPNFKVAPFLEHIKENENGY